MQWVCWLVTWLRANHFAKTSHAHGANLIWFRGQVTSERERHTCIRGCVESGAQHARRRPTCARPTFTLIFSRNAPCKLLSPSRKSATPTFTSTFTHPASQASNWRWQRFKRLLLACFRTSARSLQLTPRRRLARVCCCCFCLRALCAS